MVLSIHVIADASGLTHQQARNWQIGRVFGVGRDATVLEAVAKSTEASVRDVWKTQRGFAVHPDLDAWFVRFMEGGGGHLGPESLYRYAQDHPAPGQRVWVVNCDDFGFRCELMATSADAAAEIAIWRYNPIPRRPGDETMIRVASDGPILGRSGRTVGETFSVAWMKLPMDILAEVVVQVFSTPPKLVE